MESSVNALEECFKETEKRLDAVDKKVDAAFQEAENIKNEGKGGMYSAWILSLYVPLSLKGLPKPQKSLFVPYRTLRCPFAMNFQEIGV